MADLTCPDGLVLVSEKEIEDRPTLSFQGPNGKYLIHVHLPTGEAKITCGHCGEPATYSNPTPSPTILPEKKAKAKGRGK